MSAADNLDDNLDFWRNHFKKMNRPSNWVKSACRLKHAAGLLFKAYCSTTTLSDEENAGDQDTELAGVATLLYGLAMENMLKAALLKQGIATVNDDGIVEWEVEGAKTHGLVSISNRVSPRKLGAVELKLLERLSSFVNWAGKYPTPNSFAGKKDFADYFYQINLVAVR